MAPLSFEIFSPAVFLYVCLCVHMCLCVCVHLCMSVLVCVSVSICACVGIPCASPSGCVLVPVCIFVCVSSAMCVSMCVYVSLSLCVNYLHLCLNLSAQMRESQRHPQEVKDRQSFLEISPQTLVEVQFPKAALRILELYSPPSMSLFLQSSW